MDIEFGLFIVRVKLQVKFRFVKRVKSFVLKERERKFRDALLILSDENIPASCHINIYCSPTRLS
jgi:hypothetical protein